MALLAADVWTHWISYALLVPGLVMVVAIVIGYFVKVQSKKYPGRSTPGKQ